MTRAFGNIEDSDVPAKIHGALGDGVRCARLKSGYSIEQVAIASGLTEFEIAKIESGRLSDERLISRVARVLKVEPSVVTSSAA